MTLTLDNFTDDDLRVMADTLRHVLDMGDRIGGWGIDKATINRKSASLFVKWDNDVSPMDNRALQSIFSQAPAILSQVLNKLLDYPYAEQADKAS